MMIEVCTDKFRLKIVQLILIDQSSPIQSLQEAREAIEVEAPGTGRYSDNW